LLEDDMRNRIDEIIFTVGIGLNKWRPFSKSWTLMNLTTDHRDYGMSLMMLQDPVKRERRNQTTRLHLALCQREIIGINVEKPDTLWVFVNYL
jgi:hypothetical protein